MALGSCFVFPSQNPRSWEDQGWVEMEVEPPKMNKPPQVPPACAHLLLEHQAVLSQGQG